MCDIVLNNITESPYSFTADFSDCTNSHHGSVNVDLISEDSTAQTGTFSIVGTATDGSSVSEEETVPDAERINPSKVFKYIAKKLKEVLCPNCA